MFDTGGLSVMTMTIDATYEQGVLKPDQPLPLKEHEKVRITLTPQTVWVQETYGMIGWTGDHATLERFALDPRLDFQEGQ